MPEKVNHPPHYGGEDNRYETIKVIRAWGLHRSFALGNAVKYLSRAGKKDHYDIITDLEKAVWYIQDEIAAIRKEELYAQPPAFAQPQARSPLVPDPRQGDDQARNGPLPAGAEGG